MQQHVNWQICIFFFPHQEKKNFYVHKYMKCTRTEQLAQNPVWHMEPATSGEEFQSWSVSWS